MTPWTTEIPVEPGIYWFYGELECGSMGRHYQEDYIPEPELILVRLDRIANGTMAVAEGRFIHMVKFDKEKQREGVLGYWRPAILPSSPEDVMQLFKSQGS